MSQDRHVNQCPGMNRNNGDLITWQAIISRHKSSFVFWGKWPIIIHGRCEWPDMSLTIHTHIMTWEYFLHCWPFVRGIRQWAMDSPHKIQSLLFLLLPWIKSSTNSSVAGDLGCLNPHVDGLMQKRCNSIANAMELHHFCIKLSIWCHCDIISRHKS